MKLGNIFLDNVLTMMADTMFAKISSMVICLQNDYADVLQKNGYTYTGADGKTYNSGAYSIVHDKDFVGNKWIPFLLGTNDTTQGTCKGFCYSHSSYFAEVPEQYQRDENGNIKMENGKPVETEN
ncbi:TPA: hemagglutinin, partial [Neisseria meningitidis]